MARYKKQTTYLLTYLTRPKVEPTSWS